MVDASGYQLADGEWRSVKAGAGPRRSLTQRLRVDAWWRETAFVMAVIVAAPPDVRIAYLLCQGGWSGAEEVVLALWGGGATAVAALLWRAIRRRDAAADRAGPIA